MSDEACFNLSRMAHDYKLADKLSSLPESGIGKARQIGVEHARHGIKQGSPFSTAVMTRAYRDGFEGIEPEPDVDEVIADLEAMRDDLAK